MMRHRLLGSTPASAIGRLAGNTVAFVLTALTMSARADPIVVEQMGIDVKFTAESGHIKEVIKVLAPFNGARAWALSRWILRPPAGYVPCYAVILNASHSAEAGYLLQPIVEDGVVAAYRVVTGAWGEDFPSWRGHNVSVTLHLVAVKREYADQATAFENNGDPWPDGVIKSSDRDASKIACPVNAPGEGRAYGFADVADAPLTSITWYVAPPLVLESTLPPGCQVVNMMPPLGALPDPRCMSQVHGIFLPDLKAN